MAGQVEFGNLGFILPDQAVGNVMSLSCLDCRTVLTTLMEHQSDLRQLGVQRLALFGSTSRDKANLNSDLDFLVEFAGTITFDRYMDLKFFLEDLFNKPVDLVIEGDLKNAKPVLS
jgi:hypothetical protein